MIKQFYKLGLLVGLISIGHSVQSQTPGGVPVSAWYRADANSTLFTDTGSTVATDGSQIYQWNDYTGNGFNAIQASASSRPIFSKSNTLSNFNPTLTFDGSNDYLEFFAPDGVDVIDRASGTMYAAGFISTRKISGYLGFHASMDYPGLHVYTAEYKSLFFTGGPGYQGLSADPMPTSTHFISGAAWENGAGASPIYAGATVSLNGTHVEYTGTELINTNLSTAARNLRIGGDNNTGYFAGQINEVLVYEDRLTPDQMNRIETYFAIKYGTTLDSGTKNYYSSSGAVIWDAVANVGYIHNIAGIGRDDDGALYQKQSWSTNAGRQVLIGVGTLANTNADNTGTLSDGQFLIWSDNGEAKQLLIPIEGFAGISHRFAAVWRVTNNGGVATVRVAWRKGITNLALIQSDDEIFDLTDLVTPMSTNEIEINGVTYNYADVTFTDGQYFTFIGKAQAPGGVIEGLLMWHRADDDESIAGPKDIWRDISGNDRDVTQYNHTDYRPSLITNAIYAADGVVYNFNFNPFYYFDGTNDFFYNQGVDYFPTTNSPGSAFGVIHNSQITGWRTPFGWGDDDPNLFRDGDYYSFWRDNGQAINTGNIGMRSKPVHIGALLWRGTSNGVYLSVNGKTWYENTGIGTINSADNFAIGSEGWDLTGDGNEVHQGGISEVFAYTVDLQNSDGDELDRIYSYLAIKYGITLQDSAGTGARSYLSSTSDTVWNAIQNEGYNNNIAGIARDDNSALHQKQSQSTEKGQQVLIGTTGLDNTNKSNEVGLSDGQYLIWGDNGLAKTPSISISDVDDINFRFASVWKVQNTGSVGTVRVAWPSGLTNLTLLQSSDPDFETVDAAINMTENTTIINGVVYNYADVTLEDGSYFTFGAQLNGPGGVALNLRVWLRADAGFIPSEWIDFSGEGNHYTQAFASRQPFVSPQLYNFNPMIDFGGDGADARFMVLPAGKPYSTNGSNSTIFVTSLHRELHAFSDIIGFGATTTGEGLPNADWPVITINNRRLYLYPYGTHPEFPLVSANKVYLDDIGFTVDEPGIKYGKNGMLDTVNATVTVGNARFADGSVLGAQGDERNGLIGEVICYERDLPENEKMQVRIYVAIKYGITLAHSYVASDGSTLFWDYEEDSTYNNNIAGIARDDYGSLNQRQSRSINSSSEVIISTTGLSNANASNSVALEDMQALMWGDNGERKGPAFDIEGIDGVNKRFAAIWKVKNTNNVGTVRVAWRKGFENLTLIISDDTTFDNTDDIYTLDAVIAIDGKEYVYTDVSFSDGQYFTFAANVQAPGGVSNNLTYWYRADMFIDATDEDSADVYSWTDVFSGNPLSQIGSNPVPKRRIGHTTYFNFNPGLHFTNVNSTLANLEVHTIEALEFDIYTATLPGIIPGGNGRIFSALVNNNDIEGSIHYWDGIGIMADNRLERVTNTFDARYLDNPGGVMWASDRPSIMYNTFADLSLGKAINGNPTVSNGIHSARGEMTGGHALGSTQFLSNGSDNAGFIGHIGEIIIYGGGNNTPEERNKVETYLAIKYGVTLHNSANYTSSQGIVIWDATENAEYYNNVAGIGHDHISALHQKQSRSQHNNTNNQVTIAVGNIAETNQANTFSLEDGQFLVWGDNGETVSMSDVASSYISYEFAGSINNGRRMRRVWKVQNTDIDQEVMIRFPVNAVGNTTFPLPEENCAQYVILFADDPGFVENVSFKVLSTTDTFYEVSHTFQDGFTYFTFAKVTPVKPGVVVLPNSTETTSQYDDECNTGEWTYFHREENSLQKLIAMSGFTTDEMDQFTVNIVTEGTEYDDGENLTRMMPRVTYVEDAGDGDWDEPRKVRVYYSQDELDATLVSSGAMNHAWYKYDGTPEEVIADLVGDGKFDSLKAVILLPDAFGIEDGVNYVEFHNITSLSSFVFVSSSFEPSEVLAVDWLYFTAHEQNRGVILQWGTGSEQNNHGFVIERSMDGRQWAEIGFVPSAAESGFSTSALYYSFIDQHPHKGTNYYRLKQVSFNGQEKYSEVRWVVLKDNSNIKAVPNPTTGKLTIQGLKPGNNNIVLVNAIGQVLLVQNVYNQTDFEVDLSRFATGIYYISIKSDDGNTENVKVIKQ